MKQCQTLITALCLLLTHGVISAQRTDPITVRLSDVCKLISGSLTNLEDVFSQSFLVQVPPKQLMAGVASLSSLTGDCISTKVVTRTSDVTAQAEALTANSYSIAISLSVEEEEPYRINGLFLKSPVKVARTLDSFVDELKKLDGTTSLCVVNLSKGSVVVQKDTSLLLPIGSTFKLYILGELVRSIKSGKRSWDDVVLLNKQYMSLPSGVLHNWPVSSPITLHTLASMMISISDNTATDHLLHTLGRENVEKVQSVMGHKHPSVNIPFLSTIEMFTLKYVSNGEKARTYALASLSERKRILQELAGVPNSAIVETTTPVLPDSVEWFASTPDLCRAISWFRTNSAESSKNSVLGVLAINPGLNISKEQWSHVGFKGGSEPGVMNLTYLLQRKDGEWFALSATILNRTQPVDEAAFAALISGMIQALGLQQ